jgi:hypothetical protein
MSEMPARRRISIWYSKNGRLTTGTIGFGVKTVSGRSLVPFPPARISAFISGTEMANKIRVENQVPKIKIHLRKVPKICLKTPKMANNVDTFCSLC